MQGRGWMAAAGGAIVFVFLVAALLVLRHGQSRTDVAPAAPDLIAPEALPGPDDETLPGDDILADYADADGTPQQDLNHVYHVLDVFQLLLKIDGGLPLGSNEEIVAALTGDNPNRMVFLSADHPAIDAQGRLVDRWRSPLFFHAVSRDRIEVRSAGPDGEMWTGDDIHRNANGSFRVGDDTVPGSLFGDGGEG